MEITLDIPDTLAAKFNKMGYADPLEGLQEAAKLLLGLGPEAWTTVTLLSDEQGISPAKVLLAALNKEAPAAPKAKQSRKVDNSQRDAQIWELARTGSTHAKIAAEHGLSVIRVSQIVALQRARSLSLDAAGTPAKTLDK